LICLADNALICLADNDVIFKLAACDLLDRALDIRGLSRDQVYVLNTTKYQLQKKRSRDKLEAKYGVAGIARALEFVRSVNEIDSQPDVNELAILSAVEDIHSGEAIIFATTKTFGDIVLMGDKRSLRALCSEALCANIYDRLKGRVICFEQILSLTCAADFNGVKPGIVSARGCDKVLLSIFASALDTTIETVNAGLASYISDLRRDTKDLLVP
jgi:hypothetical protein